MVFSARHHVQLILLFSSCDVDLFIDMESHEQNLTVLLCMSSVYNYLKISFSHFPSSLQFWKNLYKY